MWCGLVTLYFTQASRIELIPSTWGCVSFPPNTLVEFLSLSKKIVLSIGAPLRISMFLLIYSFTMCCTETHFYLNFGPKTQNTTLFLVPDINGLTPCKMYDGKTINLPLFWSGHSGL